MFASAVAAPSASAFDYEIAASASDTQAGAHPTLVLSASMPGAPGATNLRFTLPDGLGISSRSTGSVCSAAATGAGECPAGTRIGSVDLESAQLGDATGDLFLTSAPSAEDVAGIAMVAHFDGNGGSVRSVGALRFVLGQSGGATQEIEFADIPLATTTGESAELSSLALTFDGHVGAPEHPLVTNPSSCPDPPAIVSSTAEGYDGDVGLADSEYAVTDCESLPFDPMIDWLFSDPVAGHATNADFEVDLPLGQSSIQNLAVYMPTAIWLKTDGVGSPSDLCPSSSMTQTEPIVFDSEGCPDQAEVGFVRLTTPLLGTPIEGSLYLVDESPLFGLAVEFHGFEGLLNVGLAQSWPKVVMTCNPLLSGGCMVRMLLAVDSLPEMPLTRIEISIGKSGRVNSNGNPLSDSFLKVAPATVKECVSPGAARAVLTPWATGDPTTINDSVSFVGCQGSGTPPDTDITVAPDGETSESSPSFEFTSSDPSATFKCKVDGGSYAACSSPFTVPAALSDGNHRVRVRAVNAAGSDPTPAESNFVVNTAPPEIPAPTITSGPSQTTPDTSARFVFGVEGELDLECRVDDGSWATCSSPFDLNEVAEGEHEFAVRSVGSGGETSSETTWSWVVDFETNMCSNEEQEPIVLGDPLQGDGGTP